MKNEEIRTWSDVAIFKRRRHLIRRFVIGQLLLFLRLGPVGVARLRFQTRFVD